MNAAQLRTSASKRAMVDALCRWFEREARDLPWRRRRSGYTALVSEFMLQQTQVARVVDCYRGFIRAFPTVRSLANADEHDVMKLWQGMGYYRRARNLHAAAKMIMREFNGRVPSTTQDLQRLPGVGRYTAGAIASIAFGASEPIVDGNVERVLMRVSARRLKAKHANDRAWLDAQSLVNLASEPGTLNEGLMELGATICLPAPASPHCGACPIARWCAAHTEGVQHLIPAAKRRSRLRIVHHHSIVIIRGKSPVVLLEQRGTKGMWARLWQVPTIEADSQLNDQELAARLTVPIDEEVRRLGKFKHTTTHRLIHFHIHVARSRSRCGVWRTLDSALEFPMSNAQRRVLQAVSQGLDEVAGSPKKIIGKPPPPIESAL